MTENKRFIAVDECVMQDNEVYVVCKGEHNADVVATTLNEFYERNEYLEKENQKLKNERDGYFHDARIYKGFLDDIAKQLEPFSRVPSLERAVDNWRNWTFRMTDEYVKLNNKYREECK